MISRDSRYPVRNITTQYCLAVFSIFLCGSAIAQNPKPQLVKFSDELLSNNAPVSMTAYALTGIFASIMGPPGGITAESEETIYHDSLIQSGSHPMAPCQSWHVVIVKNPPSRLAFLAAVFEDGSTYGDSDGVRGILDRRKKALAAYQDSIARLEADLKLGKSNQQIQLEFKSVRNQATARFQSRDLDYLYEIYDPVINGITGNGEPNGILNVMRQRADILLNSKPSLKNSP